MTNAEKEEFFQEMKLIIVGTVDRAVNKAVNEAVDKAVNKAVDKAVNKAVDKAVNKAVDKAVDSKISVAIEKAIEPLKRDINELKELKNVIIPRMQEEIRNISRSVAVIEVEHGRKLDMLFDAFTMNSENIEKNKKRINSCEKKIEKHECEIYYLKSNLKKV